MCVVCDQGYTHIHTHMQRLEETICCSAHSSPPSYLTWEWCLLLNLERCCQPAILNNPFVSALPSKVTELCGLTLQWLALYMGFVKLNSGSHDFVVVISSAEPSPPSSYNIKCYFSWRLIIWYKMNVIYDIYWQKDNSQWWRFKYFNWFFYAHMF